VQKTAQKARLGKQKTVFHFRTGPAAGCSHRRIMVEVQAESMVGGTIFHREMIPREISRALVLSLSGKKTGASALHRTITPLTEPSLLSRGTRFSSLPTGKSKTHCACAPEMAATRPAVFFAGGTDLCIQGWEARKGPRAEVRLRRRYLAVMVKTLLGKLQRVAETVVDVPDAKSAAVVPILPAMVSIAVFETFQVTSLVINDEPPTEKFPVAVNVIVVTPEMPAGTVS